MRFRGKLVDIGCIQHFTRVIGTIAKLAKSCTLRISTNKIYFILSERVANGGISIWCELTQDHFFSEYNMDGVSEEANEIYLELVPDNLMKSLKTAQNAKSIKIKLTKKHTPCLTLEVELVSIYMPPLKMVRNVIDRMKNLSNFVMVSANQNGEMRLKVETDLVTIATYFKDLDHPTWSSEDPSQSQAANKDRDPQEFAEARIDIRKFAQFLAGQQVNPLRVICNVVDSRVVHFFLLHEDVSLQYFMPVVSL